jgi:hypothetical protein
LNELIAGDNQAACDAITRRPDQSHNAGMNNRGAAVGINHDVSPALTLMASVSQFNAIISAVLLLRFRVKFATLLSLC